MILDKKVEVKISPVNYRHYKELGYDVVCGEKLNVKLEDLTFGSKSLVNVKCDVCGNEKKLCYKEYIKNTKNFIEPYCCNIKCAVEKTKKTCLKKYGVENPAQNKYITEKTKKTCLEKYGRKNYNNREKSRLTCLERYGFSNAMHNEEIKNKLKQTNNEIYGGHPMKNKIVKEKSKRTCKKNNGVEWSLKDKKIREKGKKTKKEKYGNESYSNRKKAIETNNKKFGGNAPICNEKIKNKIKKSCIIRYGVEHPMQNQKICEKAQINSKKMFIHEQTGIRYQGENEKDFLDFCFENNTKIERGKTIRYDFKERKNKVYYPDFYLKDKNLIIEIKSSYYYNLELEKNLAKQKACLDQGYDFIFIIDFNYKDFLLFF